MALEDRIAEAAAYQGEWQKPTEFNFSSPADRAEAGRRFDSGAITRTHDGVVDIADDLFELRYPDRKRDAEAREQFTRAIGERGIAYGRWFHFEWDGSLVRYPDAGDLRDLRTFRNKNVVTTAEQDMLYDSTVAVAGLSVGSSISEALTLSGIGGTQVLADFDTLSPSNLNRIRADFSQVGMSKIDIAAQKISRADPYVRQVHFRDGLNTESFDALAELKPNVIYDEIDDLAVKAMIRRFASEQGIPVVMATDVGDTSIIDVERYDQGSGKPFNGRLSKDQVDGLMTGAVDDKTKMKLSARIVGIKNASPRLLDSALEINQTLGGLPQLGTTAMVGGALGAVAGREIILGRKLDSGRYISSMKETLNLQVQTDLRETVRIFRRFIASTR